MVKLKLYRQKSHKEAYRDTQKEKKENIYIHLDIKEKGRELPNQ